MLNPIPDVTLKQILRDSLAAAGHLNAPNVHLFTNAVSPGRATQLGDLTEANFPGYVPIATAAAQIGSDPADTQIKMKFGSVTFVAGAILVPQQITGYFLTDNANAILLGAANLDTPFTMVHAGDLLTIDAKLQAAGNTEGEEEGINV